jgi:hypothetical protein
LPGFNQSSQRFCELTVRARQMPLQVFSSQGFCDDQLSSPITPRSE